MLTIDQRAQVLIQALPYIQKYNGKILAAGTGIFPRFGINRVAKIDLFSKNA